MNERRERTKINKQNFQSNLKKSSCSERNKNMINLMIDNKNVLRSLNMFTNNNRHSMSTETTKNLVQIRSIDSNEQIRKLDLTKNLTKNYLPNCLNKVNSHQKSPKTKFRKMDLFSVLNIILNLFILLITCLPVNSSNLNNLSPLSTLSNLTLNQLSSFNAYSGAIQIQYQTINETVNFTHVAYDQTTGKLYVGAINSLLQLNSDLSVEQQYQTGPIMDSIQCSASDCGQTDLILTPNIAKLLLIDNFSQKLIFCGSVKQGSCVRHSLNNVSNVEAHVPIPVAANDENSSTVAIIAPSTKQTYYNPSTSSHVMYVAATNSKLGPYRDIIPALCTRSLESGPKLFNVLEKDISEISRLDLEFHLRDYYLVNYVYAFYTDTHIYFATTQPRSASKAYEELGYSSKLARLCLEDTSYNTYAEITLQCTDQNGEDYPLLQTAYLMDAGSDLKRNLERPDDRILLAVFTKSRDHTNTPGNELMNFDLNFITHEKLFFLLIFIIFNFTGLSSAICLYTVSSIEHAFDENIRSCLNGTVSSRNMDYIANNIMECPTAVSFD